MKLLANSHLGNYEVLERLGAGGMGEVYRARDLRLGRHVALKLILEGHASDPDRLARFKREAKVLASLNHPRIAGLFGLEEADGTHFLVMELVEGETLADRLRRGPMQVEEAIATGLQIAEALEAAHERGVIHRDLKPANIKLTPDNQVKVLDFGLAKAVEPGESENAANSPTLSMMATQAGLILGTAAYMSPEQAKGLAVDHRSDIFSFGTVLFEMLTGRQPFQGDTVAEVLASVLVREPEVSGLPSDTNPRLIELVSRCLQKNPKRRWQHVGDVRAELEALLASPRSSAALQQAAVPQRPVWKRALVPVACALAAGLISGAAAWRLKPAPDPPIVRFSHVLPEGQTFTNAGRPLVALSPDGQTLVYVADRSLYRRTLSDSQSSLIAGTADSQGVTSPAFSPDGQWIAFYSVADRSLKRIPLAGGAALIICQGQNPLGIYWDAGGIVFGQPAGIMRVAPDGGTPEVLVQTTPDERAHLPQVLPGGRLLFSLARGANSDRWNHAEIAVQTLETGERKTILRGGSSARYLDSGHLLYTVDSALFAVPFDVRRLELRGSPMRVLDGIQRAGADQTGISQMALAPAGTLAYVPGGPRDRATADLAYADRSGALEPLKLPPGEYNWPRISPDGKRVAMGSADGSQDFILVYELAGTMAPKRLTFTGNNRGPIWSANGQRVTFQSDREGKGAIYWQPADGAGEAERLTTPSAGEEAHAPESWSPDGQTLLFQIMLPQRRRLATLSLPERKVAAFGGVESRFPIGAGFSPDGKWVVYSTSKGAEQPAIQVQPFPATGARYELLRRPGEDPHHPVWSRDGAELLYVPGVRQIASVKVRTTPTFGFGHTTTFARSFEVDGTVFRRSFDVAPDGRLLTAVRVEQLAGGSPAEPTNEIVVIVNWLEQLKSRVPPR